jgi:hypothetical protein
MNGEQLTLSFEPRCECGAVLVSSCNDRRGLCDRCILRRTIAGHQWKEDPEAARVHLRTWLERRGCTCHLQVYAMEPWRPCQACEALGTPPV